VTRSLALGSSELTVLNQATGYSVFANGGYRVEPRCLVDVRTGDGTIIYDSAENARPLQRVLAETTVLGMVDMLYSVVENGTGRRARIPGIHVAGKTGTTNAYKDAWFVGFTGNYVTAVWLGNDNYESSNRLTGGILPAETWQKFMRVAMAYEEARPLPGLPPPAEAREEPVVADVEGDPGASGRLGANTAEALSRLEGQFREASQTAVLQQAALDEPAANGQ